MARAKSRSMTRRSPVALLVVALVGCSGEVLQSTSTSSSATGTGGASTGQGGVGGGDPACPVLIEDAIGWKLVFPDGAILSPLIPEQKKVGDKQDQTCEGEVVAVAPGHLTIDTCPPNADCAKSLLDFTVVSKVSPFEIGIPLHTLVHVHLMSEVLGSPQGTQVSFRTLSLQIDNLATWGGFSNPIEAGSDLWFFASDAGVSRYAQQAGGLGFQHDSVCDGLDPTNPNQEGTLSFWDLTAPSAKVTLQSGETKLLTLKSPARPMLIRNIESTFALVEGPWAPDFLVSRAQLLE